eukprot:TRINITY_DN641_c0_g2_i1.p1 TRINITY_DN641_c0_g2~~TRINITY_DN641_c0_g2_i1.p1  ORF type:complete len:375 (+),score=86.23 TRINITY_DN641_c0_g2_i1:997-2121(+)
MDVTQHGKDGSYFLSLKAFTWGRDSHGLFDYEDLHPDRKTFNTGNTCYLIRKGNTQAEVILVTEEQKKTQVETGDAVLFKMVPSPSKPDVFVIETCSTTGMYEEAGDKLWLVIRALKLNEKQEEYKLKRGEILKLGRIRLKVKDYRLEKSSVESDRKSSQIEDGPIDISFCNDTPDDDNDLCRICFNNTSTGENPLFAPCKCTGTVKFVHFSCLKSWLNLKLVSQLTSNLRYYYWKSFECEICKTIYPFCVTHQKTKYYLVDIEGPKTGDFILVESLIHEKNTSRLISYIIPSDEKKDFKLGRGHESDMRIGDISVSRFHAILKCRDDGFYIEDNNSKFGTLALVNSVVMQPSLSRAVQVGRTAVYFGVKSAGK